MGAGGDVWSMNEMTWFMRCGDPDSWLHFGPSSVIAVYCNHKRGQCIFHFAIHFVCVVVCLFIPASDMARECTDWIPLSPSLPLSLSPSLSPSLSLLLYPLSLSPSLPLSSPLSSSLSLSSLFSFFFLSFLSFFGNCTLINEVWFWRKCATLGFSE